MIKNSEFYPLVNLLNTLKGEKFYYLPNPGNAGDSAIFVATLQLFDTLSLTYEIITKISHELENKTVVIGGGGALSSGESSLAKKLYDTLLISKMVIVLPHTARNIDEVLANCDTRLSFFCRERATFSYVKNFKQFNSFLTHDIVFLLNLEICKELPTKKESIKLIYLFLKNIFFRHQLKFRIKDLIKALRARQIVKNHLNSISDKTVLNAFRTDSESSKIKIPYENYDISSLFQININDPALAMVSTKMMTHFLRHFNEVNTNRLHVAIISALLGKHVRFYDNSYFKCREVFLHSMLSNFENVEFIEYRGNTLNRI